jgi:outer membrane protein assembly factor BamB
VLARSIHNSYFYSVGPSYGGGPMLGANGNAILYLGTGAPGLPRLLANFSTAPAPGSMRWMKPLYSSQPAIAGGVVYASQRGRFDAIDENSGNILWSWTPPAGELLQFNTLITDTIAFVSSETRLYAISMTDPAHGVIWSAATPGYTAMSKDNLLLVSTVIAGKPTLVAYSVQ